jgi:alpha-1,6-mannosyltransferase
MSRARQSGRAAAISSEGGASTVAAPGRLAGAPALGRLIGGRGRAQVGARAPRRRQIALGAIAGVAMLFTTGWIVADAAVGGSPLLPYSPYFTGWLRHLTGQRLTYAVFLGCLLGFTAAYAVLVPIARQLPTRALVVLLGLLYLICFIGPILLSTDVFSYIAYARMGALHGLNPYVHVPANIAHDPIYPYVGTDWIFTPTAYGPLYTLLTYPFAFLGVVGAIWGMKALALIGCVAMDWLAYRCARMRSIDPKLTLIVVGANPLVVIYSLASAHNDFLMIALMMAAIYLTIGAPVAAEGKEAADQGARVPTGGRRAMPLRREAWSASALVVGTLVKATVAAILPFMILGRRRAGAILGTVLSLVVGLLIAYLAFGLHGVDIISVLNRDSMYVSTDSFATEIAHLLGKPGVYPIDHTILKGVLVAIGLYLLWRTWRGYDWVAASGWALLAITVTSTWLLAWYLIWPLPIAAVSRDRRLLYATLAVQLFFIVHQISPLFTPE